MFFIFWSLAMLFSGFLWFCIFFGKDLKSDKHCRYALWGLVISLVIVLCSIGLY